MFEIRLDAQLWSFPMGKKRAPKADHTLAFELVVDMEPHLIEVSALVGALEFAGEAMIAQGNKECGAPVAALAGVTVDRMHGLLSDWRRLFRAVAVTKSTG